MDESEPGDDGDQPVPPILQRVRSTRATADEETISDLDDRVESVFELLGRTHALSIMRLFAVEGGPWRFSELEARVDTSPHTLSKRLTELQEAGLLERHAYDETPPRVEYVWTEAAQALSPAVDGVYEWALVHDAPVAEDTN